MAIAAAVALGHCPTCTIESCRFLCPCPDSARAAPTPILRLLRRLSSSTPFSHRAAGSRRRCLRMPGSSPLEESSFSQEEEEEEEVGDDDLESDLELGQGLLKKGRNQKKREARRAVKWGMDLAEFSPPQIKRVLRAAYLDKEVFDALMLVKRLGPDVREGRRRQFNYIGKLLREAQPELMDGLIQASKDGDSSKLQALAGQETFAVEDEYEEEEDAEYEDGCDFYVDTANRWLDGLIFKDSSVTNEVYSIYNVEFDRQELRKLVRRVHSITEHQPGEERVRDNDMALLTAKNALARFLRVLAKHSVAE